MNLIEKLNSIDINDLKNIDINEIKSTIKNNPDILINILLIAITLCVTIFIYKNNSKQLAVHKSKISKYSERLKISRNSTELQNQHNDFVKVFPESLEDDQMVEVLSKFVANRGMQIISFSPAKSEIDEYKKLTFVNINFESTNFKNILLFINDIESSNNTLRIDNLKARTQQTYLTSRKRYRKDGEEEKTDQQELNITISVKIGSVSLNEKQLLQ